MGGLGNQIFQYAMGRALCSHLRRELKIDLTFFSKDTSANGFTARPYALDIFNIAATPWDIDDAEENEFAVIRERGFAFDGSIFERAGLVKYPIVLAGYWQSPKYFAPIEDQLRRELSFKTVLTGRWAALSRKIRDTHAVMLNVRRGDYLIKQDVHRVVSIEYLRWAIWKIDGLVADATYFIFSDDIGWCREHICIEADHYYVDEGFYDPKFDRYLQLMSQCKHFILSNSSFCWWAAWLSTNKDKVVIAPEKWFNSGIDTKDLFPENWIIL